MRLFYHLPVPFQHFTCGQRTIISIMHARKTANSTNRISDPMAIASLTLFLWSTAHSLAAVCFLIRMFLFFALSIAFIGRRFASCMILWFRAIRVCTRSTHTWCSSIVCNIIYATQEYPGLQSNNRADRIHMHPANAFHNYDCACADAFNCVLREFLTPFRRDTLCVMLHSKPLQA